MVWEVYDILMQKDVKTYFDVIQLSAKQNQPWNTTYLIKIREITTFNPCLGGLKNHPGFSRCDTLNVFWGTTKSIPGCSMGLECLPTFGLDFMVNVGINIPIPWSIWDCHFATTAVIGFHGRIVEMLIPSCQSPIEFSGPKDQGNIGNL